MLTLVQSKQMEINIHKKQHKNTVQTIQNTVDTSIHITKTLAHTNTHTLQNPHITKPTHTHTHTLQNPHIHTPTHYKTHTYTHPHTHTLQNPHMHTPTHYKIHTYTHAHITKPTHTHTHTYTHVHITKPTHTHTQTHTHYTKLHTFKPYPHTLSDFGIPPRCK